MSAIIVLTICTLILLAYLFDVTSTKTKIPSVILLLLLGWLVRQVTDILHITLFDLNPILSVLGTIGLILIVLEGSLELEINKHQLPYIFKSSILAFFPILILSFVIALPFQYFGHTSLKIALANAIPFAIISSAIVISSVKNINKQDREFVSYESSLSDIFGVLFFNFITLNNSINFTAFSNFFIEIIVILLITAFSTFVLAFFLNFIKHHIKYIPIVVCIIMIYEIAKIYHLPALVFILIFGLFLGNINELKHLKILNRLNTDLLKPEINKFHELTLEVSFLVRALFFLLFGFLMETKDIINYHTFIWSFYIFVVIYLIRFIFLKSFKLNLNPLLYIAPRGLITILLYLSIPLNQQLDLVNKSLIIQVILLTSLFMMLGLIKNKKNVI